MVIVLYKNNSPNNYVQKNLAGQLTLQGSLREESSVIDPIIMIEAENLSSFNYLYISSFSRYYYIVNVDSVRTGLWRVRCHVDVLMTYRSQIKAHQAIVSKVSDTDKADLMIDDGDWVCENKKLNTIITFPFGLNEQGENILITAGWVP